MQQQQHVQAQEFAQRLGKEIAAERLRSKAQAEEEQARAADVQQQLAQAQKAASKLKGAAEIERAQLKA